MNRALLILPFIFILSPSIHLIDPFPDFIGWIMLFYALRHAKYLSVQAEYAVASIKKMIILSLVGASCVFLVPISDGTMILTLTFALGVLKLMWGIPAIKYFYSAVTELGALYDGKTLYLPIFEDGSEGIKTVESVSLKAFIVNTVVLVIPEFAELTAHSSVIYSEGYRTLASFKPIFYVATVFIQLLFAAACVWVVSIFAGRMANDNAFSDRISTAYNDKTVKTNKTMADALNLVFLFKLLSGIFLFCVISGAFDVMPAFLYVIITLVAFIVLRRFGYKSNAGIALASVSIAVSIAAYVINLIFASKYVFDDIAYSFEAYDLYSYECMLLVIQTVILIVTEFFFKMIFVKVSREHAMREILDIDNEKYIESRRYEENRIKKRAIISFILFFVMLVGNTVAYILAPEMGMSWLFAVIIDLIWFIYNYSLYSNVREGIENRYL